MIAWRKVVCVREEGCVCALECSIKDKADCTFKERGATSSLPATPFCSSSLPATPPCGLFLPAAVHVCVHGKYTLCQGGAGERQQC